MNQGDWIKFSLRAYCGGKNLIWLTERIQAFMQEMGQDMGTREVAIFMNTLPSSAQEFFEEIKLAMRLRQMGKGYTEEGISGEVLDELQSKMFLPRFGEN